MVAGQFHSGGMALHRPERRVVPRLMPNSWKLGVAASFRSARKSPNPREETMVRAYIKSAVAGAFLLSMATAALAVTGEYGNRCTMGLAFGKDVQTDCSVNAQLQGKTYCFGSKSAMTEFMGILRAISPRRRRIIRRCAPSRLELLMNARGPFPFGEGPFYYSWPVYKPLNDFPKWVISGHHGGYVVGPFMPHKQKRFTTRQGLACNARALHIRRSREGLCAGRLLR